MAKAAAKKMTKKVAAKKSPAKKAAPKSAVKPTARKVVAKKATRKAAVKKSAVKKPAKKAAAKKAVAKKAAGKKVAVKKAAVKKAAPVKRKKSVPARLRPPNRRLRADGATDRRLTKFGARRFANSDQPVRERSVRARASAGGLSPSPARVTMLRSQSRNGFYWPTPNGGKISIVLEECGLPYDLRSASSSSRAFSRSRRTTWARDHRSRRARRRAARRSRFSSPA